MTPAPESASRRWGRRAWSLFLAAAWVFVLWRLAPHVGALIGVRGGDGLRPAYAVRTLDHGMVTADSLRGQVVLVNFWATWCGPCRVEMPLMEKTWSRHRAAGLVVLGLSVDRTGEPGVRRFLSERGISYPVAIVGPEVEAAFGGVRGYPTSVLIGRDGVVRHTVVGPIGPVTLEPAIRRALAEPAGDGARTPWRGARRPGAP